MEYNNQKIGQFLRFGIVGALSTAVHYGIYYVLLFVIHATIAYATGYVISFLGNYFLTSYYTFRTTPTWKHFLGFAGSHAINFGLHMVLFSLFLWLGINKLVIPFFVIGISMVVQFTILRWVFAPHEKENADVA